MATTYIDWTSGSPTTEFYLQCDRVSQSIANNSTRLGIHIGAINRGSSSSFSNYNGYQQGQVDGVGVAAQEGPMNPFLATGHAANSLRWDTYGEIDIPHNSDGTRGAVTLRMILAYGPSGATGGQFTAAFSDFPAIPRGPRIKNVDGTWHTSTAYIKNVDGTWHVATPYIKNVDGTWHTAGG